MNVQIYIAANRSSFLVEVIETVRIVYFLSKEACNYAVSCTHQIPNKLEIFLIYKAHRLSGQYDDLGAILGRLMNSRLPRLAKFR